MISNIKIAACMIACSGCFGCTLAQNSPKIASNKPHIDTNSNPVDNNKINVAKGSAVTMNVPEELKKNFGEQNAKLIYLYSIMGAVHKNHVVSYSMDELILKAIEGFLANLDPHTAYLDEKAYKSLLEQTDGEFGGIGTEIILDSGLIRIITPIDDTPAYKAGIKPGDYILCIDEEYINGITAEEAINKLRGKPGTTVKLKIKRTNKDPFDVVIKRDLIKIKSVKAEILDDIAYIRISTFDKNTTAAIKQFLNKSYKQIKGIVLDIRNNPGGLLNEAVSVTDLFLDQGVIVTTKGRDPKNLLEFKATASNTFKELPLVVIVNSGTASAPEIVAGALQDHKRAVIVGIRTFGKGSVQQIVPLSKNTGMKITIAMHYRPSGACIQGHGITPDIIVNPALIHEIKDVAFLREENIKHSIGGLNKDSPVLIETKSQKALTLEPEDKTILDHICDFFSTNLSHKQDKNQLTKLKDKLKQINEKQKKSDTDIEDDLEVIYRTAPLKERVQKDLQLRTAFNIIAISDSLKQKR